MNPIISIIVPVYNAENTLQRCVESVTNQTYPFFELILIDDGSTDSSGKLCDRYSESDERVRVFHQENKGVSEARNTGLEQVSGQYVCFLDGDDEFYPETLEKYLESISRYGADGLLGSLEVIGKTNNNIIGFNNECCYGKDVWEEICLNFQPFGYVIGKMFKTDIIRGIRFNKNMISQEDLDFNLEVFNRCKSIATISIPQYKYYYSVSQRSPQIIDYIKNQLKLYDYAEANYQISDDAKKAVLERIAVLAYTALYNTKSKDEYNHLTDKICSLQALEKHTNKFKSYKVRHGIFMERTIRKEHLLNYIYLRTRKKITKIVRMLRS